MNHVSWGGSGTFIANYEQIQGINWLITFVTFNVLLPAEKVRFQGDTVLTKFRQSARGNAVE